MSEAASTVSCPSSRSHCSVKARISPSPPLRRGHHLQPPTCLRRPEKPSFTGAPRPGSFPSQGFQPHGLQDPGATRRQVQHLTSLPGPARPRPPDSSLRHLGTHKMSIFAKNETRANLMLAQMLSFLLRQLWPQRSAQHQPVLNASRIQASHCELRVS